MPIIFDPDGFETCGHEPAAGTVFTNGRTRYLCAECLAEHKRRAERTRREAVRREREQADEERA